MASYLSTGLSVLSSQPTTGLFGTKVFLRVSSQYDLFTMASPMPYFFLQFGSEKSPMQDIARESQDGFTYTGSADAPQFHMTRCSDVNVPLSLVVEGPSGEELARGGAGSFEYLDASDDVTRQGTKPPEQKTEGTVSHVDQPSPTDAKPDALSSNTYGYAPNAAAAGTTSTAYDGAFSQTTPNMITTYRSSSFTSPPYHHHRRGVPLWNNYGPPTLGSTPGSLVGGSRPSLAPIPTMPSSPRIGRGTMPQLIRTSTISTSASAGMGGGYLPQMYSPKAVLDIKGDLSAMAENWTQEEWDNRRRIVVFRRTQSGATLTARFRAVSVNERPPNSVCISCIWWAERGECFVTSVDTIYLLEQLVAAPNRFTVEEKNRIRRNLEGFHPKTVSKGKRDSEDFFKLIMGFGNPKPRNIEKDVKVFAWKDLASSLRKIIGKYSANPHAASSHMATPVSSAPYATLSLPTPPGHHGYSSQQSLPSTQPDHHHHNPHSHYSMPSTQHDSIPSPRSLTGSHNGGSTWSYPATTPGYSSAITRTLSPSVRIPSPQSSHHPPPMRINTNPLPAVTTLDTRAPSTYGSGLHTPSSHHPSAVTPPRWDLPSTSYDTYPSLASLSGHGHGHGHGHHAPSHHVYPAPTAYADGVSRA